MIEIKVSTKGKLVELPRQAHSGDACRDLRAAVESPLKLFPGRCEAIPTGLYVELPEAVLGGFDDQPFVWEIQIRPRSGLAYKHGIIVANSPGTIDVGFRGEIKVLLMNTSDKVFTIYPEDRIAQMALCKSYQFNWLPSEELEESDRGEGGFGSSGTK